MYEVDPTTVSTALTAAGTTFSANTISQILSLTTSPSSATVVIEQTRADANGNVTVAAGTEIALIGSSDVVRTTIAAPSNAPVVIFEGKGGVVATFNNAAATVPAGDQTKVERVVVGSSGNDAILIKDATNTKIILGTGNSTVVAGAGVDTIEAGVGNSTISGGTSDYTVVKLAGTSASNYTVRSVDGHAVVTNSTTNKVTDISKIQFVQLDSGNAMVFAKDSNEAAVSLLFRTTFGRDADAGGLDYWFDLAKAGASLSQIAAGFAGSAEFAAKAPVTNADFINSLYVNTFGRAGETAGIDYWTEAMANGTSRAELIKMFASIGSQNIDGTATHTEATVVGSVTIVTGII